MYKQAITSILIVALLTFFSVATKAQVPQTGLREPVLTRSEASHFAQLALKCVTREYPNKPDHTINDANDIKSPRVMHPSFYGCYDWHSSVHGHWMLVRLLRLFPGLPEASQIR